MENLLRNGQTEACRPGPHGYFSWRGFGVSRCGRVLSVSASLGQSISGGLGVPGLEGWGDCRQGRAEAQRVVCYPALPPTASLTDSEPVRSGVPPQFHISGILPVLQKWLTLARLPVWRPWVTPSQTAQSARLPVWGPGPRPPRLHKKGSVLVQAQTILASR